MAMIEKLPSRIRYFTLILCVSFATPIQAAQDAQDANSYYGGVFGGLTLVPDLASTRLGTSGDLETDAGFNVGGVFGYKWAFGLRTEGEISYRQNDADKLFGSPADGDINAIAFMGNAWYDVHTGTPLIPYVGGGLGVAYGSADISAFGSKLVDDSDIVFAWQVGGGIGYEISPGIVISADYRYQATTDPEFKDVLGNKIDTEYSSHSIMLGIRGHL